MNSVKARIDTPENENEFELGGDDINIQNMIQFQNAG